METCCGCAFWVWDRMGPDYRGDGHSATTIEFMSGDCRRRAPIHGERHFGVGGSPNWSSQWPVTTGTSGCGEWQAAPILVETDTSSDFHDIGDGLEADFQEQK